MKTILQYIAFVIYKIKFINFCEIVRSKNYVLFSKTFKAFVHCTAYLFSNFNSCLERLCEGVGPTPRKYDSCDSTVAIIYGLFTEKG